jgi:hypothetical protein
MRRRVGRGGRGGRGAKRVCIVSRRGSERGPRLRVRKRGKEGVWVQMAWRWERWGAGDGGREGWGGSSECVREGGMGTPSLPLPHTLGPSKVQGSDTAWRRSSRGGRVCGRGKEGVRAGSDRCRWQEGGKEGCRGAVLRLGRDVHPTWVMSTSV